MVEALYSFNPGYIFNLKFCFIIWKYAFVQHFYIKSFSLNRDRCSSVGVGLPGGGIISGIHCNVPCKFYESSGTGELVQNISFRLTLLHSAETQTAPPWRAGHSPSLVPCVQGQHTIPARAVSASPWVSDQRELYKTLPVHLFSPCPAPPQKKIKQNSFIFYK